MWPNDAPQEVWDLLSQYTGRGFGRVHLAILKLCEGDKARIPELVKTAQRDYRDVLAAAENPEEFALTAEQRKSLPPRKLEAIRRRDRRQYRRWMKR
jgi:hypothetical protein